ncbi:MAG: hypothetical protein JSU81_06775, partial [Candidatus Coatesbacteria bacterium]
ALLILTICALASSAPATYPGSVISSFYAAPLRYGSVTYFPQGLTYGDGYLWVMYADGIVTKRQFPSGSLIGTFVCPPPAWGGETAWNSARKYVYIRSVWTGVVWAESAGGSVIGSFPKPPGAGPLYGIEYDDYNTSRPIWVGDGNTVWNLTSAGSLINSFNCSAWPRRPRAYAFDGDTSGGPYILIGAVRPAAHPWVYVVNPANFSLISSFASPLLPGHLTDITWDGRYLWALESGETTSGWVYRFVAHSSPAVAPASLGRIKALYR